MSDVRVTFAVGLGADFVREEDLPEPAVLRQDLREGGIDGALIVSVGGRELLDERYWDRLDQALPRLIDGLEAVRETVEVTVELPDTRLEVALSLTGDVVRLDLQERAIEAPHAALLTELRRCARRLALLLEDAFGDLPEACAELEPYKR